MRKFGLMVLAAMLTGSAHGQEKGPATGAAAANPASAKARQTMLDVVVTDGAGKPVNGLMAQEFTITDNKQPVKPASFEAKQHGAADTTVSVMLVLDNYNEALVTQ